METPSNMPSSNLVDDIPDIPDELVDDDVTGPLSNGTASNHSALSSEDLDSMNFDSLAQRDEVNRATLDPPKGDWDKEDRWTFGSRVVEGNCELGDLDSRGRTVFNVFGKPKPRTANGIEYHPTLFVRVSPDVRYKEDGKTLDLQHRLWLKVKDLHLALHDRALSTPKQLKAMLEEDEYQVSTVKGSDGPIVVDVRAKRARR